jgi:hypothetical protein
MIEKIATSIIVFGSSLLFMYWFRYVCLLVLSARPTRDYAAIAATANQLRFKSVQTVLRQRVITDPDELRRLLDHDYQVLAYLWTHVADPIAGVAAIERRMLEIDYRLMSLWYRASSPFSRVAACQALDEMSEVVAHFADAIGQLMVGVAVPK